MENTVFTDPHSISLRPFYLAKGMGRLCIHQQGGKSSAKRETLFEINDICFELSSDLDPASIKLQGIRPSTWVPPMFLRELRGEVPENIGQVEDAYRTKDNLCFEPSRSHSKPASHQLLRRSSFVQKNWGSICCVCIKYSNCLRRVNVLCSKTSFVMSIRLNRS